MTSSLQQQARALGDPTRHAIFRYLSQAPGPVAVAELAAQVGCHHNAVRQHLTKLSAAGLVVESKAAADGPGRPRLLYAVEPEVLGSWGTVGPYERLSELLVEVISTGAAPVAVGRRAGRHLLPAPSGHGPTDLTAAMARHGFEPQAHPTHGGVEVHLARCPFEAAAAVDREVVCGLHLGLADGVVDGTATEVVELVAHDPARAGCRLRLRTVDPDGRTVADTADRRLTIRGRRGR